jgi:Cu/Zn superoxide dismutase
MKRSIHSIAIAAALLLAATATSAADKAMTVPIKAQNGSGETGTATLTPQGDKTKVEVMLNGAPSSAQPAHIHEGSCAKLDPKPKYPLENVTGGKSSTVLPVSVSALMSGGYAINVHKSTDDLKTYVACGDIAKG